MGEEEITETTPLTSGVPKPRYAFESSIARQRKRKVRQFQCCVCSIFLTIIAVAVVISVAYNINDFTNDANNTQVVFPNNTLLILALQWPLEDFNATHLHINSSEYKEALDVGKKALHDREKIEQTTPQLEKDSPSYKHQKIVATSNKGRYLSKLGYAEVHATTHFNRDRKNISILCFNETTDIFFSEACDKPKLNCNVFQKFRSYNGSCNNLEHPDQFGVGYRPFRRILPPDYEDGINMPRVGKDGKPLPSARTVSVTIHRPIYRDDPKFTVMLAVFGQFLDHDITATALNQGEDGSSISCCADNIIKQHPECFPVELDKEDAFYKNFNVTCMEFVRSAPAPTCCFGPRQQLNQVSSYIDASVIYGSDEDIVNKLRTFQNGSLKMYQTNDNRMLLPISDGAFDGCNREEENKKGRYCFMAGDARANENLHLTSMHLLWARQHNLIASELLKFNPHWDDERIFHETRRIVGAQLQHITYNEFLPILLGNFMESFDLSPLTMGYYSGYNKSLDATIANAFAASAFRFAHTLIPTLIKMMTNESSNPEYIEMHKMLLDPFKLYKFGEMDSALRGALHTHIQASDPYFTPELKEHMFERPVAMDRVNSTKLCGLDLVSLNIQRGRDHGLAGYTSWREHCGLPRPRTFNQLAGDIDDDSLNYIQSVYRHVDDIDFYTGSLSEKPLDNGFLGPTLTCMILDQFIRLKRGDRFWYETPTEPQAFSPKQLQEIRKTSLANIICDNSDNVQYVQPFVMKRSVRNNRPIKCVNINRTNLKFWKEKFEYIPLGDGKISVKSKG